jgi:hypothetical protein
MSAAFVCYIGADVEAAIASFGDRGYRMVTIAAGVVAQRICVKAGGHGISVRTSDAYGVAECRAMLGVPPGHIPLFQLVAGRDRPGAGAGERFRLQLRF